MKSKEIISKLQYLGHQSFITDLKFQLESITSGFHLKSKFDEFIFYSKEGIVESMGQEHYDDLIKDFNKVFNIVIERVNKSMDDKMKLYFFESCLVDEWRSRADMRTLNLEELDFARFICKGISIHKSYNLIYKAFYHYCETQFITSFGYYKDVLIDKGWYFLSHVYDIIEDEIDKIESVDEKNIRLFIAAKVYDDLFDYIYSFILNDPLF